MNSKFRRALKIGFWNMPRLPKALREHGASDRVALGLTAPEEFVTDMQEAAALVGAIRNILERPGSGATS
jgi:hypothetical protein